MNNNDFKNELSTNSEKIVAVINDDPFPAHIEPTFLREAVRDYPLQGGKRLRSALLSWSCGALGGNPESARFAAAAVEIYHNWTLVHDDIIDDDATRRNTPTTHAKLADMAKNDRKIENDDAKRFGRDFAILAGDIQQGWAANMLLNSIDAGVHPKMTIFLSKLLHTSVTMQLISGEALDVEFSYPNSTSPTLQDVERMLSLKTGALLQYCAVAGAIIAIDTSPHGEIMRRKKVECILFDERVSALANFANKAGTAFQLRDDWLGIFGNEETLGKPICSDIAEGKPTILLMETLSALKGSDLKRFKSFIGRKKLSKSDICDICDLSKQSGAGEKVDQKAKTLLNEAKQSIAPLPASHYKDLLLTWADFLVNRNH
jgi:geranylgeranyl diphosphate synthase type I